MENEEVIEAFGCEYFFTDWDWIKMILSLGLYYCLVLREKRFQRYAYVVRSTRLCKIVSNNSACSDSVRFVYFCNIISSPTSELSRSVFSILEVRSPRIMGVSVSPHDHSSHLRMARLE